VGGEGEAFRVQKGAGKALGSVIAEGDFRRAFPDSFKRGVVRKKSLFSVSSRSVIVKLSLLWLKFLLIFNGFEVKAVADVGVAI